MTIHSNRLVETIRMNGHFIDFGGVIAMLAFYYILNLWQGFLSGNDAPTLAVVFNNDTIHDCYYRFPEVPFFSFLTHAR